MAKKARDKPTKKRLDPGTSPQLASEIANLRKSVERLTDALTAAPHGAVAVREYGQFESAREFFPLALGGLTFKERFPFGVWQSNDSAQRWHLDFNDNGCAWIERAASGATLKRQVDVEHVGPIWRIHRPNDNEALRFLGASPTVTGEILARNPQPSFINIDFMADRIQGEWNGVRWILDTQGHLKSLEQPGSTPATIKQYSLMRQGDDAQWFKVAKGQLTFDQEGDEGSTLFHSRWLHWPGGASGVTLGRGYDMGQCSGASIRSDLTTAGVDATLVAAFGGGARLTGSAANDFVAQKRTVCGNITPGQQLRLFTAVYQVLEDDTERICNLPDVVMKFGAVDFTKLDQRIWTVVVDLRFRGDYTPAARDIMQKAIVKNDIAAFKTAMSDRLDWPNAPQARFDARVKALS